MVLLLCQKLLYELIVPRGCFPSMIYCLIGSLVSRATLDCLPVQFNVHCCVNDMTYKDLSLKFIMK